MYARTYSRTISIDPRRCSNFIVDHFRELLLEARHAALCEKALGYIPGHTSIFIFAHRNANDGATVRSLYRDVD